MAMEKCIACGNLILWGALFIDGKPCCPRCMSKRQEEQKALAAQWETMHNLQRARESYDSALAELRLSPSDPLLREQALKMGRLYASWTRYAGGQHGVTLFDEVALANDIDAACAGAGSQQTTSAGHRDDLSPEERLQRLVDLRAKNLLTEQEYVAKRKQILSEL